jgi:hypothetical protein
MGSGLVEVIYLTVIWQSYNYLLHNLTPCKLKTLSSLFCVLAPGVFLVIPSPAVWCLPQYLSLCPGSVLHCPDMADKSSPAVQ